MNSNNSNNTIAIIGLVLGIIAILFSFIPCVGTLAFIPGVIGLILGVIALLKAKDNGDPKGMSIAVIVVSVLACAISGYQMFAIGNLASDMKTNMKEYTSCDEITKDYNTVKTEMETLTKSMEEDNASFSSITKITKLGIKLGHIQEESIRLDCEIKFDNFNPAGLNERGNAGKGESDGEGVGEGEGEEESIEEESGN